VVGKFYPFTQKKILKQGEKRMLNPTLKYCNQYLDSLLDNAKSHYQFYFITLTFKDVYSQKPVEFYQRYLRVFCSRLYCRTTNPKARRLLKERFIIAAFLEESATKSAISANLNTPNASQYPKMTPHHLHCILCVPNRYQEHFLKRCVEKVVANSADMLEIQLKDMFFRIKDKYSSKKNKLDFFTAKVFWVRNNTALKSVSSYCTKRQCYATPENILIV
jgi:hypothetical protein